MPRFIGISLNKIKNPFFNIVLVEPEIPNNTGSIGRTCVGTQCRLHLVGRLGFDISERAVRRAGLDYWENIDLMRHDTWANLYDQVSDKSRMFYFSKKASRSYFQAQFKPGDWLIFGRETTGLSESLLRDVEAQTWRIPMYGPIRSLNLSNSVSIVIYEGIRQLRND